LRFPLPYQAAAVIVMAVAVSALVWRGDLEMQASMDDQRKAIADLGARVASLERNQARQADWPSIAAAVEPAVVTIEAGDSTGSGWVAYSGAAGSDIVTNFHVVADSFSAGDAAVRVRRKDTTIDGIVVRVDISDDLAIVHVAERLASLASAQGRPVLGATVMAIGSPLGLDGSVTLGLWISQHRRKRLRPVFGADQSRQQRRTRDRLEGSRCRRRLGEARRNGGRGAVAGDSGSNGLLEPGDLQGQRHLTSLSTAISRPSMTNGKPVRGER
jgi:S1-C subfamily serine protease